MDGAARAAGRDPAEIERTVAVLVRLPDGAAGSRAAADGRRYRRWRDRADEIAATLRAFAAEGIGHVQLVVDPITLASIDALAPVLEELDRG